MNNFIARFHTCDEKILLRNMVKNRFAHFNPEKYKIESKIAVVKLIIREKI